jgi:hypothetical protein
LAHSWLSFQTPAGTLAPARASRTVLTGRGGARRLKAASCWSMLDSSALVLLRTSIFQVPARSIDAMAELTIACVARQLNATRQSDAEHERGTNGSLT